MPSSRRGFSPPTGSGWSPSTIPTEPRTRNSTGAVCPPSLASRWCSCSHGPCNRRGARSSSAESGPTINKENAMPLVQVKLIEGVFSHDQKQEIITRLTETMVDIEGEAMRPVTWVTVEEVNSGEWGVGGKALTTQDVKDLQASGK